MEMKECKNCGCYTDEKCEICITCQSKQWQENLGDRKDDKKNETK